MTDQVNSSAGLDAAIRELASILFHEQSAEATLGAVADVAQRATPTCRVASITLVDRGRPSTPVSTGELGLQMDQVQYDTGEGPCLDAIRTEQVLHVEDMAASTSWPAFRDAALASGITSILSLPLRAGGQVFGALNLYGAEARGFRGYEQVGELIAQQAAVTVTNAQGFYRAADLAENLAVALEHRDVIGQAKGILIAQGDLSSDEAFDVLRRASQRENRKLYEIARDVVERRDGSTLVSPA